jgi:hypothetical protein
MKVIARVRIHQYNDPEVLEFLNAHSIEYQLAGDHLFILRGARGDLAAGPGDWLAVTPGGELELTRGDYALRVRLAVRRAEKARREREAVVA